MIVFDRDEAVLSGEASSAYLRLNSVLRIRSRGIWTEPAHTVQAHTIFYMQDGDMNANVNGNPVYISEDHFLLVLKGQHFFCSTENPLGCLLYKLTFSICNVPAFDQLTRPCLIGKNAHLGDLCYHLHHSQKIKRKLHITSDAILALILEQCLSSQKGNQAGEELFNRFCEYVESNLGGDLSADRISEALCYNKDYICRIVKQFSGKTMKEYISCEKLYMAKVLLVKRNCSISEIAKTLGFSSDELFSKFFRYYTHITPTEYKRQYPADANL